MPADSASSFALVGRDLAREHGAFTVLDGVDVTIGPRTRLGVIGPNGIGKTTLLRLLAGVERPDRGVVTCTPPTLRVGYLPQEPDRSDTETLAAFLARRAGVAGAEEELERSAAALASGDAGADDAYAAALDGYLGAGGPDFDARMRAVCDDLGLPQSRLDLPTRALSGGQAARASLAAILLSRFDVFLLDEPTNDLDFAGLDAPGAVPRRDPRSGRAREPRPGLSRSDGHARARARRAHASGHRVRRRLAGIPRRARDGTPSRRRAVHGVPVGTRASSRRRARDATAVGGAGGARREAKPARQRQGTARLPPQSHREAGGQGEERPSGRSSASTSSRSRGRAGTCGIETRRRAAERRRS